MTFLMDRWRRIGTRLYLALGFAVALTLVSGAVGVYYFEQSGDANYQVRSESVPALEASWAAAREAERLRNLGLGLVAAESGFQGSESEAVAGSLERLETALSQVRSVPELAPLTASVSDAAFDLAEVIDELTLNRDELQIANEAAADYRLRLATTTSGIGESDAALSVLQQALQSDEEDSLDGLWDEFSSLYAAGVDPAVASLGEGEGVFFVRGRQLALEANIRDLALSFDASSATLVDSVSNLLEASGAQSSESLTLAVSSFDEGRTLLTVISVISVIVATLAAWLWVGNGMVRRLSRMSERMRRMADGDLETPVPEVGRDEITKGCRRSESRPTTPLAPITAPAVRTVAVMAKETNPSNAIIFHINPLPTGVDGATESPPTPLPRRMPYPSSEAQEYVRRLSASKCQVLEGAGH